MTCPYCQAKLMPVDGQMFCLQCGEVTAPDPAADRSGPILEETTDPLLQRAIVDAVAHEVVFRLPVAQAPPVQPKTRAFASMRTVLSPSRPAAVYQQKQKLQPELPEATPIVSRTMERAGLLSDDDYVRQPELIVQPVGGMSFKIGVSSINLLPADLHRRMRSRMRLRVLSRFGVELLILVSIFVVLNIGLWFYYADRVFPGVRVGNIDFSNTPLSLLHQKVATNVVDIKTTIRVGGDSYDLDQAALAEIDQSRVEREVKALGRNISLPLAGIVYTLFSNPIERYGNISEDALDKAVKDLALRVNRPSSPAALMIVRGRAFVLPSRSGTILDEDKARETIRGGYGKYQSLSLSPASVQPVVLASSFEKELQEVQARLDLSLQIKRKGVVYAPTREQIGSWLAVRGPGKGIDINEAEVAGFIAAIPGSFDRVAATNALIVAVRDKQSLDYTVSIRKVTKTPSLPAVGNAEPIVYRYCVVAKTVDQKRELRDEVDRTLAKSNGWSLGGHIKFVLAESNCNFSFVLADSRELKEVDKACEGAVSCLADNRLMIDASYWNKPPQVWKDGLAGFRSEVVSHEVGHWLGFDHAPCLKQGPPISVLESPALVLEGCSSNWYSVPEGSTKHLNAF